MRNENKTPPALGMYLALIWVTLFFGALHVAAEFKNSLVGVGEEFVDCWQSIGDRHG